VPFFFKQWGEYEYDDRVFTSSRLWEIKGQGWLAGTGAKLVAIDGSTPRNGGEIYAAEKAGLFPLAIAYKVGKKNAGRTLDGRTWDEVPK
jgi:protein gp37